MSTIGYSSAQPVSQADAEERARFMRRTYGHLAGAVAAFVGLECYLLQTSLGVNMLSWMAGGRYRWLMILGGFALVTWLARGIAAGSPSKAMQYFGLAIYVVAEAVIFVPILFIAVRKSTPDLLPCAALMTGLLFAGLTVTALTSRRDFSFLGGFLTVGGFVALGLIIGGAVFGFTLGLLFSGAMIILASGAILYDTSKIMRYYPTDRYVGAALELFASVALLFWYVLRLFMSLQRR